MVKSGEMMKKVLYVIFVFILAALLLTGCAGSTSSVGEAESAGGEQTELEIWMCYDRNVPGSYYVFLWDDLAEEYGYTVNVKTYSQQEIEDKISMALVCNELPDIFMVPGGSYPEYLFEAGACLSVSNLIEESDFLSQYTEPWTDGENYLIPCLPESYAVTYYDEELMERIGLSEPETWDDLIDLVKSVNEYNEENGTDYAAIELGMKDSWMGELLNCMIAERIDPDLYAGLAEGSDSETNRLLAESAEYIEELIDLGAFPDNFLEIGEQEAVKNFIGHNSVMMLHQSSLVYHLIQNMGVDGFSLSLFPGFDDISDASYEDNLIDFNHTYTPGLAVSVRSPYREEAAELCLEFAERANEINVTEYGYLNITDADEPLPENINKNVTTVLDMASGAVRTDAFIYNILPSGSSAKWDTLSKRFYAKEVNAKEYLSELEDLLRSN